MTELIGQLAAFFGVYSSEVRPVLAVLLVSMTCGLVGSLVVGNRMAFFSDAMAHTAFAGVSFSLLGIVVATGVRSTREADQYLWAVPLVTAAIGALVGAAIVYVRERTLLTTDTVIGVFFATSLGLAALMLPILRGRVKVDLEQIIFGQLAGVEERDLLILLGLATVTLLIVLFKYNDFVMGSFHPSLARSRGLSVRMDTYLFVVLLALVVNLSIQAVGILLINALLIVPAAAAANVSSNLRKMFWYTLAGSMAAGLLGYYLSTRVVIADPVAGPLRPGPGGAIVLTCVAMFIGSLGVKVLRRRFFGRHHIHDHTCADSTYDGQYHTH